MEQGAAVSRPLLYDLQNKGLPLRTECQEFPGFPLCHDAGPQPGPTQKCPIAGIQISDQRCPPSQLHPAVEAAHAGCMGREQDLACPRLASNLKRCVEREPRTSKLPLFPFQAQADSGSSELPPWQYAAPLDLGTGGMAPAEALDPAGPAGQFPHPFPGRPPAARNAGRLCGPAGSPPRGSSRTAGGTAGHISGKLPPDRP